MLTNMQKVETSFYVKADKVNNSGLVPVYCRIRINATECTYSTGYVVEPAKWKKLKQYRIASKEHDITIRRGIDNLREKILSAVKIADENNINVSATNLKEEILNPGSFKLKKDYSLLDAFQRHHDEFAIKVKTGSRSTSTLSKFNTTKNHIVKFLKYKYNTKDFPLQRLNFEFINSFHWYMRSEANCDHNYTVRRCEFLKSVVKLTRMLEWMEKDPFLLYNEKRKEVGTVYLTNEELHKLINVKLSKTKYEIVRDLFLFTVYTGYAGIDVLNLTPEHMIKHTDGKYWIFTKRQKTGIDSNVPLLRPALDLIKKYKNDKDCLLKNKLMPKRSNQKINMPLKEIARLAGIKKRLYYYVARHTFATTICLANGVSLEALSKMMGHKRITQTQHYAKIMNTKVSAEMILLDDKLIGQF